MVGARAARAVIRGELWVVINGHGRPDHYVLRVGKDRFLDGDGVACAQMVLWRLINLELATGPLYLRPAPESEWIAGEIDAGDDMQPALEASVREWLGQARDGKQRNANRCNPARSLAAIVIP